MSGNRLLLDTNIILGYLSGKREAVAFLNGQTESELFVSVITRIELLSFPRISAEEESAVNEFLGYMAAIPLDREVERIAIEIRRNTGIKLPDAIIAATAVHIQATLVTADERLANTSFPELTAINPG